MPEVQLPSVEEALTKAQALMTSEKKVIAFVGPAGGGKTSALERLARAHANPIRLQVPHDDDGAVAAIGMLADQLPSKAQSIVRDTKRSYLERLEDLISLLPADAGIFFDEPVLTSALGSWEEPIFTVRAREFSTRLLAPSPQIKVLASSAPSATLSLLGAELIGVARKANPQAVLESSGLQGAKIEALLEAYETTLQTRSPIEIRLAAHAAKTVPLASLVKSGFRLRDLVTLATKQVNAAVRSILGRLALVRESNVKPWLDWACQNAKPQDRQLVETVFLFGEGAALSLHESIASLSFHEHWLAPLKRQAAHRELANEYLKGFSKATDTAKLTKAFHAECEVVHHRTEAGDASVLKDSIYFAEQYDVLGRMFGQRARRLFFDESYTASKKANRDAIECYERALGNDAEDWYAAHYLAFNRDILGEDVVAVEEAYKRGLALNPSFAWGHSRWIRFLINCGRNDEAMSAFEESLEHCPGAGNLASESLYRELHLDVARQYLQFGDYERAEKVLERVPESVRLDLDRYEPLVRYAKWQREPAMNELVFPASVSLLEREKPSFPPKPGEELIEFMPGRLANIGKAGNEYRFRVKLPSGVFGWRNESAKNLKALGLQKYLPLQPGTFVEFQKLKVGSKVERRASIHPVSNPFEKLEVLYPAPDRYLET